MKSATTLQSNICVCGESFVHSARFCYNCGCTSMATIYIGEAELHKARKIVECGSSGYTSEAHLVTKTRRRLEGVNLIIKIVIKTTTTSNFICENLAAWIIFYGLWQ